MSATDETLIDRCASYEQLYLHPDKTVAGECEELRNDLELYCQQITTHMSKQCGIAILSGNFFFKQDLKGEFYLLYVTSIKCARPFQCLNGDRIVNIKLHQELINDVQLGQHHLAEAQTKCAFPKKEQMFLSQQPASSNLGVEPNPASLINISEYDQSNAESYP